MFMHGGWLHIIGNMLFLWVFGNNVEDRMGRARFVLFYLLRESRRCTPSRWSTPRAPCRRSARRAVAGVLGGYILLHPRARVVTLVFIVFFVTLIEIPAMILGVWAVLQFLPALGQLGTDVGRAARSPTSPTWARFLFGLAAISCSARDGMMNTGRR